MKPSPPNVLSLGVILVILPTSTASASLRCCGGRSALLVDTMIATMITASSLVRMVSSLLSLPLDGGGRLAGDIVHDPVDALHLVDDPRRDPRQQLVRQVRPVRRHVIFRLHRP